MTASQDNYPQLHLSLIEQHKQNFCRHALASLENLKEFKETNDCGTCWVKTDTRLVETWSSKVEAVDSVSLRALCDSISSGLPTPALDRIVSIYVCRLTGKLPNGDRFFMN